jgi:diguanylate cyclase (GGDEF)-like protein/PAS domain S-box-containing protein
MRSRKTRCTQPSYITEANPLPATEAVARYPQLLDKVPAIIYVAEPGVSGQWNYVSPQIESILGFSAEQWRADPTLWERQLHPEDRERILGREEGSAVGSPESGPVEYRMRHRDGHTVWIRDDAALLDDGDGVSRWHGVLSDVTERKQVEAELEHRAAQQAAVARLGEHALQGARISDLMKEAVREATEILGVEEAGVLELLPDEDAFVPRSSIGWPDWVTRDTRVASGTGSQSGYTVLIGAPVVVTDWERERRFHKSRILEETDARSGMSVVIEGTDGPFGVLAVHSVRARSYGSSDLAFLQSLANVLADGLQRQATEDDIRHRALHDSLTGLPNRVLFLDRLGQALARLPRRDSLAAILFLDLDRFKLINDSLGHQVGDELLAAVAPRLTQALRSSDTVARFGGDEFGILLEDVSGEHDAIEMASRIAGVFARPFVLAGSEHFITTSIGIALARGGELPEELIRDADAAMYRAKERGRARYEVFDELMRGRVIARLRVENDLRRALERDELRLDYQPVISLSDGTIVSLEALLRWDHPTRGLISPAEFIPIAEESGLIEPIGRWVLERACRQAATWYRSRPDAAPVGVSVNLSAIEVTRRSTPQAVEEILRGTRLLPELLSLEITERVMLRDADGLSEVLDALKAIGVQLVLDDFGTGYSSLGYLTRLPLDAIKIDRSFVDGLGVESCDSAITEAIIAMSRALSLEVVAEGVETAVQADELARLGCRLAQGFLFAGPLPPATITRLLRDGISGSAPRR